MTEPRHSLLLVEDNLHDVHAVLRRLRDAPYGVRHVRTGGEALALTEREGHIAILLDHRLPDIPGVEVCRRMRAQGVTAPILLFSSVKDDAVAAQAFQAGASDYLVKDMTMADLPTLLESHVNP